MAILITSSGDLSADRRFEYAEALMADGDAAAAADLMQDTLVRVPTWTAGWYRLGEMAEAAGRTDTAIEAFAQAAALDPADRLGAGLRRDLLRRVPVAEAMPAAFVETLFDQYADRFEASLVGQLGYRGPEVIAAALPGPLGRVLDLGCGTGLMGAAIRDRVMRLDGFDLSAEMLRVAEAKGVYDRLKKADLNELHLTGETWDTIIAADVFIYLGALERIIGWIAGSLVRGGRVAFSVEAGEGAAFDLRPSRRYAHSEAYLRGLLQDAGFNGIEIGHSVLRRDRGEEIAALIVVASVPANARDKTDEAAEAA